MKYVLDACVGVKWALDEDLSDKARQLRQDYQAGIYDCLYVALGEQEGCEVVTADDKMINNLQSTFPFIIHLSSLP